MRRSKILFGSTLAVATLAIAADHWTAIRPAPEAEPAAFRATAVPGAASPANAAAPLDAPCGVAAPVAMPCGALPMAAPCGAGSAGRGTATVRPVPTAAPCGVAPVRTAAPCGAVPVLAHPCGALPVSPCAPG